MRASSISQCMRACVRRPKKSGVFKAHYLWVGGIRTVTRGGRRDGVITSTITIYNNNNGRSGSTERVRRVEEER